jgi:hypothetical protein
MFWAIVAYVLAPVGLLTCILLLSGSSRLERWGAGICSWCVKLGSVEVRLDRICTLVAIITFSVEALKLTNSETEAATVELRDRQMMARWRHERNYWISLYMLTLWIVAGRVAYLIELKSKDRPKWE